MGAGCAPQPRAKAPEAAEEPRARKRPTAPSDTGSAGEVFSEPSPEGQPQRSIFLSQLEVVTSPRVEALVREAGNDGAFASGLEVRMEVLSSDKRFGEVTRRAKQTVKQGSIQLSDLSELGSRDKPTKAQTTSSFIIDFDQPEVEQMLRPLANTDKPPAPARIEAFVNRHIEQKTYIRSFDVASRVAGNRAGDCTEHAVLAAAALRYFGYPARVVLGVVLVGVQREKQASVVAAGHAWVEYYEKQKWWVLDAALYVENEKNAEDRIGVVELPDGGKVLKAYVPINVLKNESVAYARALMNEPGLEAVVRLVLDSHAGAH